MSFEKLADRANTEEVTDQLTFNVGERSFNVESATTKIVNADAHIATLEAENAALKAKEAQSTSIDEALAQLREQNVAPPQNSQATEPTSTVSEEQIREIANKQYAEQSAADQLAANTKAANDLATATYKDTGDKLTAIYGDKTDEAMAAKAVELGITTQALFDMAKSPATAQLLLQTMQINSAPSQSSPSGGFNSAGLVNQQTEKLVDYSKPITSSTLLTALQKSGGGYN